MPDSRRKHETIHAAPPSPICLPLQKFSYATVVHNSVGPLPWKHVVSKGDIFAVFETTRTLNADGTTKDSKRFKILQDPTTMEDLDLEALAYESRRAIDTAKDASEHSRDHNVAVIKKVPVIAVKYPIYGGQVKRFQIRFTTDADFYETLKQLSNAGVHMLEAGTFPSNRPQTAQPSQAPSAMYLPTRPAIAAAGAMVNVPALETSISRLPGTASESMPPPPVPGLFANNTLQYGQQYSTVTAQPHVYISAIESTPNHLLDLGQEQSAFKAAAAAAAPPQAATFVPVPPSGPAAIDMYTPRPSTAPSKVLQHLSQVLPPKRDLPFGRTSARLSPPKDAALVAAAGESASNNAHQRTSDRAETLIPDSQASADAGADTAKEAKSSSKTAKPKKQPTSTVSKPTRGKAATRTKEQKCDACKRKGARTRCNHKQASPPLPSIEEVFNRGEVDAPCDRNGNTLDTQTLLTRAAASTKKTPTCKIREQARQASLAPSNLRVTRSMSVAARSAAAEEENVPTDLLIKPEAQLRPQQEAPAFPCTPIGQLIHPNTTLAPVGALAPDVPFEALPTLSRYEPQAQPDLVTPAAAPTAVAPNPLSDEILDILTNNPLFALPDDKLASFGSLQPQQQTHALEQWCIHMYRNEDFRVLCRVLDGSVKAQLALTL